MTTRTGNFLIGFRRGWSEWTRQLPALLSWAARSGFAAVDLMNVTPEDVASVTAHGLRIGSADLLDFGQLLQDDPSARKALIDRNLQYIRRLAPLGVKVFFTCVIPDDPARPRIESYRRAVDVFIPLSAAAAECGAKIAIEGWPGGAPHYANLCCTPETCRAFLRDVGGDAIGINYDPSHLIRLGVDHIRFLREFAPRVWHVHAKDTELFPEAAYEFGTYSAGVFQSPHPFGEHVWRYTIPGHGVARWHEILRILSESGYRGVVSVELEDGNFNGTEAGEKTGLELSRDFLRGV
ncbi:MAG: sugar phosphate isomerase/epimerase [Phycisphaerae bacterium]|nr:sugar phosphate isomerase/epimerase [Phycisphaerae bacterium]MDW8261912.1 sugar phosphate isomerase/epimerase [Phycisphaerales bacterium]